MNSQSIIACFAFYVLLSLAVVTLVRGEERPPDRPRVPEGETSAISDWALAGVIWSDASLTKKLAMAAARQTDDPARFEELEGIARQAHQTIELMEEFGWRQVERTPPTAEDEDAAATAPNAGSTARVDSGEGDSREDDSREDADSPLPSPARVGQQIAQSLDASPDRIRPPRRSPPPVKRELPTPPGVGEPGRAETPMETPVPRSEFDLSHYRVEDDPDVIPGQPRTRAEAIRHGVQQAIAAGVGRGGLDGGVGRISEREMMTRSGTMPYSAGSIYDADDYDPNIDYNVNNPLGMFSRNPQSLDLAEHETPEGPPRVIEDEDDLIADLARERRGLPAARDLRQDDAALLEEASERPQLPNVVKGEETEPAAGRDPAQRDPAQRDSQESVDQQPRANAIERFTSVDEQLQADANWVQLQIDANQLWWLRLVNQRLTPAHLQDVVNRLQIHAELAYQATSSEPLRQALQPWVK